MRFILLMLFSVSATAADITIDPPTKYDDGSELLSTDIDHYEVCISQTTKDVCDQVISVAGNTIASDQIANAYRVRARTVDINGLKSTMWSNSVVFKYPLPPGLTITINIHVGA